MIFIVAIVATSCDLTKNDETTPVEEHCKSDEVNKTAFSKLDYSPTYYCFSEEGGYIKLRYLGFDVSNVCTSKSVGVWGWVLLSKAQTYPIQVILKLWWGPLDANCLEVPLTKTITGNNYDKYIFQTSSISELNPDEFDISGYFPSGSGATVHLSLDYKFLSSGNNTQDQNYLKSVFQGFFFYTYTYSY